MKNNTFSKKKNSLRRTVWLRMLYFNIYSFIWSEKSYFHTFILPEWTIILPVSESAASFKMRVLNYNV